MPSAESNDPSLPSASFEALALPYMNALYGKAFHLTHSPEDAGDLVQETYLRAYRTFAHFTEGTNCKAWLFTILYSIFINQYRKHRREPEAISMDTLEDIHHRELANPEWERAFTSMEGRGLDWYHPEVSQALARLPVDFSAAVLLVDVEEFSYEDASAILNCPIGTLRSRLFRARRALFQELYDFARGMNLLREPPSLT